MHTARVYLGSGRSEPSFSCLWFTFTFSTRQHFPSRAPLCHSFHLTCPLLPSCSIGCCLPGPPWMGIPSTHPGWFLFLTRPSTSILSILCVLFPHPWFHHKHPGGHPFQISSPPDPDHLSLPVPAKEDGGEEGGHTGPEKVAPDGVGASLLPYVIHAPVTCPGNIQVTYGGRPGFEALEDGDRRGQG